MNDPFYLIEKNNEPLWWFPSSDKARPMDNYSFGGQSRHFAGYWPVDGWTTDANRAFQFKTHGEAQRHIDMHDMKDVIVTEHLFYEP